MDTNAKAHNGQERSAGGRASADRRGGLLGCRGEVMESDEGSGEAAARENTSLQYNCSPHPALTRLASSLCAGTKPQGRPAAAPGLAAPAGCSEAAAPAKAGGRPLDTSAPNWRRIKPHGGMDMHHPATGAAVLMLEDACDEEQVGGWADGMSLQGGKCRRSVGLSCGSEFPGNVRVMCVSRIPRAPQCLSRYGHHAHSHPVALCCIAHPAPPAG